MQRCGPCVESRKNPECHWRLNVGAPLAGSHGRVQDPRLPAAMKLRRAATARRDRRPRQ